MFDAIENIPSVDMTAKDELDMAPPTYLSTERDRSEVTIVPEAAFYALIAALAKHRGMNRAFRSAPMAVTCGQAHYRFAVATIQGRMMVQMVHTHNYARLVALPSEISHAKNKSDDAHRKAEVARKILETEETTAAPILAQTEEHSDWADGEYSGGQKRTSVAQREMIEMRLSKARETAESAREQADILAAEVKSLLDEQINKSVETRVFTLEQIEQGAILPMFRRPKVDNDAV